MHEIISKKRMQPDSTKKDIELIKSINKGSGSEIVELMKIALLSPDFMSAESEKKIRSSQVFSEYIKEVNSVKRKKISNKKDIELIKSINKVSGSEVVELIKIADLAPDFMSADSNKKIGSSQVFSEYITEVNSVKCKKIFNSKKTCTYENTISKKKKYQSLKIKSVFANKDNKLSNNPRNYLDALFSSFELDQE